MQCIAQPLNIIFQHLLYEETFPLAWKQAIVIPLYKGRGDQTMLSSYRAIS